MAVARQTIGVRVRCGCGAPHLVTLVAPTAELTADSALLEFRGFRCDVCGWRYQLGFLCQTVKR